jgi:hypothetical protein
MTRPKLHATVPPPPMQRDPDIEREVVEHMRRAGALDALRESTIAALKTNEELKTFAEFAVRSSQALRDPYARSRSRKELVDELFVEIEQRLMDEVRAKTFEALTETEAGAVGREAYERTYAAREEIKHDGR